MEQSAQKVSLGQRWGAARPTKTAVFWACVASAVVTMILGFTWGGWVTGGTARSMAEAAGADAVVTRLAPICVVQFKLDTKNAEAQGPDRHRRLGPERLRQEAGLGHDARREESGQPCRG